MDNIEPTNQFGVNIMKSVFKTGILTAALLALPLSANAGHCKHNNSGMKHGYQHSHPMAKHYYYKESRMRSDGYGMPPAQMRPYTKHSNGAGASSASAGNIIETATSAGNFSTLLNAVRASGLEETLEGKGPFTVFAPTDAAFAKIPPKILSAIVADKDALREVLAYHVVAGKVSSSQVAGMKSARTVQGSSVNIDTSSGVNVGGANVVKADIQASNGIIHVIDSVMLPN